MSKIEILDYSLRDLKDKFENRDFAIPEIQRQYVWSKRQICDLMDSILKNYSRMAGTVFKSSSHTAE